MLQQQQQQQSLFVLLLYMIIKKIILEIKLEYWLPGITIGASGARKPVVFVCFFVVVFSLQTQMKLT